MQITFKMTETLANGYSSESTLRVLSKAYQYDSLDGLQKCLGPCALDKNSLSIGMVNTYMFTVADLVQEAACRLTHLEIDEKGGSWLGTDFL